MHLVGYWYQFYWLNTGKLILALSVAVLGVKPSAFVNNVKIQV